jgi:drug/metabolite transporter (DMT)-like permease
MFFLLMSILSNATIFFLFKLFGRFGVQTLPAIVVNYYMAFTIGILFVPDLSRALEGASSWPLWTTGGLALGVLFILVFNLTGTTARIIGVSVTTIASKMSLALAVLLFVWVDPNERMTLTKGVAILVAMSGVYFSSLKPDGRKLHILSFALPALILLGSTGVDFGIAYFSSLPANDDELKLYSCLSFFMAGLCGTAYLGYGLRRGTVTITWRDVAGGLVLGAVNYGSIIFLVLAYDSGMMQKSALLPVNNLGVVLVSAIAAVLIFKEKLTRYNWVGVGLSVLALVLLLI